MRKLTAILVLTAACAAAQAPVTLSKPRMEGGKPLMEALRERKSTREFSNEKLSPAMLSNLLWAAFGVNRADGRRTAPSANNRQEIDIYVATAEGAFVYDAKGHRLAPVSAEDVRPATGTQAFVKDAPLNLVYVVDGARAGGGSGEDRMLFWGADAGFIAQNVYLFCASEGLATVVRGSVDRAALGKALRLRPDQRIILAQTVGYGKK
jgi:nitroreductase